MIAGHHENEDTLKKQVKDCRVRTDEQGQRQPVLRTGCKREKLKLVKKDVVQV